jgi:RNA polymerase sigma-70 factor (ECF subfamily)
VETRVAFSLAGDQTVQTFRKNRAPGYVAYLEDQRGSMNEKQFDEVFRAHLDSLSRYLLRRVPVDEVQNLVSDTFEVAWRKRRQCPEGSELAWLYRIAALEVGNYRRKSSNRARIFAGLAEPLDAPSAESIAIADIALSRAWVKLTVLEQRVLSLAAFEGLGPKELATAMDVSINAATIRLHRAREKLRKFLDE